MMCLFKKKKTSICDFLSNINHNDIKQYRRKATRKYTKMPWLHLGVEITTKLLLFSAARFLHCHYF